METLESLPIQEKRGTSNHVILMLVVAIILSIVSLGMAIVVLALMEGMLQYQCMFTLQVFYLSVYSEKYVVGQTNGKTSAKLFPDRFASRCGVIAQFPHSQRLPNLR